MRQILTIGALMLTMHGWAQETKPFTPLSSELTGPSGSGNDIEAKKPEKGFTPMNGNLTITPTESPARKERQESKGFKEVNATIPKKK